jgi:hypothetical protein
VFLATVPVALGTLVVARRVLPESRAEQATGHLDVGGAITITAALMVGVYAITRFDPSRGIAGSFPVGIVASALLIGAFWLIERSVPEPLIDAGLLRIRKLWGASIGIAANAAAYGAAVFIGTLYLQRIGYSATATGLLLLPLAIGAFATPLFGRLLIRHAAHLVALTGQLATAVALATFAYLAQLGSGNPYAVALSLLLLGLGQYCAWVALVGQATTDVEQSHYGAASGIFKTSTHVGAAVSVAISATLIDSAAQTSVNAYTLAYLTAAVTTVLGAVVSARFLRSPH